MSASHVQSCLVNTSCTVAFLSFLVQSVSPCTVIPCTVIPCTVVPCTVIPCTVGHVHNFRVVFRSYLIHSVQIHYSFPSSLHVHMSLSSSAAAAVLCSSSSRKTFLQPITSCCCCFASLSRGSLMTRRQVRFIMRLPPRQQQPPSPPPAVGLSRPPRLVSRRPQVTLPHHPMFRMKFRLRNYKMK